MNDSEKFKKVIDSFKKRIDPITSRIDEIVTRIDSGKVRSWGNVKTELGVLYERLRVVIRDWAKTEIPAQYRDSLKETIADIKQTAIHVPQVKYGDLSKGGDNLKDVLNNVLTSFKDGIDSGEKALVRLVNLTQQIQTTEARINKAIAKGYEAGGSVNASRKKLQETLLARAKEGKYVEVVDRNGNIRNYGVKEYAELVARTKLMDASAQAVLNTADRIGQDLVQISSHNTLTPLCAEYEGKIFSLSGSDPNFPVLDQTPPFHPNCLHSMSIVFVEALQADGTLQKYIDFSNNETDRPPTFPGFVPIADREMI